jgi:multimeric flavodoxin WrbA
MKILVLSGSRNPQGKTAQAIGSIRKGIMAADGESECLFLPELNLERCRQCDPDGWGLCRKEGSCIIEDDFPSLVEKIKTSDAVVFANAVYFGDLTESMRGFLDRLRRIRFLRKDPGTLQGIPAVGICYAGGSGNGAPNCCASLDRVLQICGFDVVDMVPLRRQNLEVKLPALEIIGKWLVTKPSSGQRLMSTVR